MYLNLTTSQGSRVVEVPVGIDRLRELICIVHTAIGC